MNYDDYLELVKSRRSMRAFTTEMVSDEDITKILDAARYAPSGMNFQPWQFIVVRDKEKIEQLVNIEPQSLKLPFFIKKALSKKLQSENKSMPKQIKSAKNASALIVLVGDTRKNINLPGQMYKYKNNKIKLGIKAPMVNIDGLWYSSMANAFMIMITAAATLGIGCQYCTFTSSKLREKKVKGILGLPDYIKVYDAAAIGYPAYTPRPKYMRNLEDIVHYEKYDKAKEQSDEFIHDRALKRMDMKYIDNQQEY